LSDEPCVLIVSRDYAEIRAALREAGYATAGLPEPEAAREIFDSMAPALVVIDVELAGRPGRSFAYFVRIMSRHPRTPLIGLGDAPAGEPAPSERFDAVQPRPLRFDDLLALVDRLVPKPPA
jgi:DNA-binding NtrC family response regulator